MIRCLGFPICTNMVEDTNITCKKCWRNISEFKEGYRLRSEYLAARRNFAGTKLCKQAEKRLEEFLHASLSFGQRKRDNIKNFTIVG